MKDEKQQLARDLYLQAGKTQTEISDILNVNRKTVYLWAKKGKWEEIKHAVDLAPTVLLHQTYDHIGAVNRRIASHEDGCPEPAEVEMLRKLFKMTKDIGGTYTGAYMEAYEELSTYMSGKDHELNKKFVDCTLEYVRGKFGDGDENHKITRRIRQSINRVKENLKRQEEETFAHAYQAEKMFPTDPEVLAREAELSPLSADEIFAMQETPLPLFPSAAEALAKEAISPRSPLSAAEGFSAKEAEAPITNKENDKGGLDLHVNQINHTNHSHPERSRRTDKMGKNGAFSENTKNTLKPNTNNTFSENTDQTKCPISAIKKYIESGAFEYSANPRPPLVASDNYSLMGKLAPKETWKFMPLDKYGVPVINAAYYATLLPVHRPSPYREGDTIWVNYKNDIIEDIAKHLKMGDTIRYYPGMDPNEKFNDRTTQLRQQQTAPGNNSPSI